MAEDQEAKQQETLQRLYAFIIEQLKTGTDRSLIVQRLVDMGLEKPDAARGVDAVETQLRQAILQERVTGTAIAAALVGAVGASIVGGLLWGLIVIVTHYEIGFMAWGVGLLAGFAVAILARGRRGTPLQAIAVLSSILGIVVGKYVIFFHLVRQEVIKQYGAETVARMVSPLSIKAIQIFIDALPSLASGFDAIWIGLAVLTAWRIPQGIGIKLRGGAAEVIKEA